MKRSLSRSQMLTLVALATASTSCGPTVPAHIRVPAVEYSKRIAAQHGRAPVPSDHAQIIAAGTGLPLPPQVSQANYENDAKARFVAAGGQEGTQPAPGFYEYRSKSGNTRDYNGPLALGDPGLSSSLWRETSSTNDMFRDVRAFAPMDLLTIVVSENSKGSKTANTEVKESSDVTASIPNLIGLEKTIASGNPNVNLSALVKAALANNFKGEGKTDREGKLTATISAVVAEVLPSGVLRIEGEKIISVNSEEQTMVISGLVRPQDINSSNQVDSSKIADLRIDYYGSGIIGEAQNGGWLSRLMRRVWPF